MKRHLFGPVVITAILVLLLVPAQSRAAADPALDTAQWHEVRATLFGTRPINEDSANIIQLEVPARPDSGALVPVHVRAKFPQTATRFVKQILIVIDRNPEPLAVRFHLMPESGIADLTTFMRVETHSPLRAQAPAQDTVSSGALSPFARARRPSVTTCESAPRRPM